jgi:hypothetical protein
LIQDALRDRAPGVDVERALLGSMIAIKHDMPSTHEYPMNEAALLNSIRDVETRVQLAQSFRDAPQTGADSAQASGMTIHVRAQAGQFQANRNQRHRAGPSSHGIRVGF